MYYLKFLRLFVLFKEFFFYKNKCNIQNNYNDISVEININTKYTSVHALNNRSSRWP